MSATNFKVGDIVRLSDVGKKQYQDAKYNPYDLTGVITKVNSIIVKWSNGETNSYDPRHIELVEPKQEQYYTSIPTDVKVGDKFKLVYTKSIGTTSEDMDIKWCSDRGFNIGDIVFLKHNDGSSCPKFENNGKTLYLNWGWLKPVEEDVVTNSKLKQYPLTPDEMIKPKVGDLVLLKKGSGWVKSMNKYNNTIQQIAFIDDSNNFNIVDHPIWNFKFSDIVKIVEKDQQFNLGDEVEFITQTGITTSFEIGDRGFITEYNSRDNTYYVKINGYSQWLRPSQIKLINDKIEQNVSKESSTNNSMSFSTTSYKITRGEDCRTGAIRCTKSQIKI